MDLIQALSSQLGIPTEQAQAVAGGAIGFLKDKLGADAPKVDAAVPELGGWEKAAAGASSGGGLLGMAAGMLGGSAGEAAGLVAILAKVGLDADKAQMVAPLVVDFLKSRLPPDLVSKVLAVAPMLTGGGGGAAGALGALGGLLK